MDDARFAANHALPTPRILQRFQSAKQTSKTVQISAPMVRYSKLPFRLLVSQYGGDVVYTPMILAHEFIRSQIARDSDFTTSPQEHQNGKVLVAQFASNDPEEFARAAEMIAPWVDGVDLNCGCPQSWALKEGIGCSLMEDEEKVGEMVRAAKARLKKSGMANRSVSVKIRVDKNLSKTVNWVKVVQEAGVDYITVHGRTRSQRSSTPPDFSAVKELRKHIKCPMVANGDVYCADDVARIVGLTGADGVMAARGLMENPALFDGFDVTPQRVVGEFLHVAVRCPIPFPLVLHHVCEMTGKMVGMNKGIKKALMECRDLVDLIDFVEERWGLERG